jgi:hypothetical protein
MTPGIADFWLNASDLASLAACITGTILLALAIRGPAFIREIADYRVDNVGKSSGLQRSQTL